MPVRKLRWLLLLLLLATSILPTIREQRYAATGLAVSGGLAVFWDENCTEKADFIEWGTFRPGSTRSVELYAWNGMDEPVFLYMETENWVPLNARDCIEAELRGNMRSFKPREASRITLTLHIPFQVYNLTSFGFDMILSSVSYPFADLDKDKRVDMRDVGITAKAYGSYLGHPRWNLTADLNKDGKVCFLDVTIVLKEYGLQ